MVKTYLCSFLILLALTFAPVAAYAEEAVEGSGEEIDDVQYLQLDPINLPVIFDDGSSQHIMMVVSLEVANGQLNYDKVQAYEPRLADAYIQDLYGYLSTGYGFINNDILDVQQVKARLKEITAHVISEEDLVHDILLQVVQQRPLHR